MHRSLSLHIYLRIDLAKPADVGAETEAGDEQRAEQPEAGEHYWWMCSAAVVSQLYTSLSR